MGLARRTILSILYIVIVAGLTLAIVLSFTHKTSTKTKPSTPSHSVAASKKPTTNNQSSASSKASAAATATTPSSSTTELTNTGPGNDVALFLSVSTFATFLHWLVKRRQVILKLNKV
jgi:cytoskeletal protein RodZ